MFQPLLGHHQVALNLQGNSTIQSVYAMGDEISFTMVRYMNLIKVKHCYMFRHHRVILRQLVINTLPSYTSISNAAVGNTS